MVTNVNNSCQVWFIIRSDQKPEAKLNLSIIIYNFRWSHSLNYILSLMNKGVGCDLI